MEFLNHKYISQEPKKHLKIDSDEMKLDKSYDKLVVFIFCIHPFFEILSENCKRDHPLCN